MTNHFFPINFMAGTCKECTFFIIASCEPLILVVDIPTQILLTILLFIDCSNNFDESQKGVIVNKQCAEGSSVSFPGD